MVRALIEMPNTHTHRVNTTLRHTRCKNLSSGVAKHLSLLPDLGFLSTFRLSGSFAVRFFFFLSSFLLFLYLTFERIFVFCVVIEKCVYFSLHSHCSRIFCFSICMATCVMFGDRFDSTIWVLLFVAVETFSPLATKTAFCYFAIHKTVANLCCTSKFYTIE